MRSGISVSKSFSPPPTEEVCVQEPTILVYVAKYMIMYSNVTNEYATLANLANFKRFIRLESKIGKFDFVLIRQIDSTIGVRLIT